MILDKYSSAFKDVPLIVKQRINAEDLHKNNFGMAYKRAIPSADNTLKHIQICYALFKQFSFTFYNYKGEVLGVIFR